MENKNIKLKVIFKDEKKKDGTTFKKMLTILKGRGENGKDKWIQIKFGPNVNTKAWKNQHQIICAEDKTFEDGSKNINIPSSFEPFEYKGRKIYPSVYIQEIIGSVVYTPKKITNNSVDVDQNSFDMADVDEDLPW